jgi:uncharacterized protein (DUF736 family)
MKYRLLLSILACCLLCTPASAAQPRAFSFGVVAQSFKTTQEETALSEAITEADEDKLAFVVANGIKTSDEPCSDEVYERRKVLLNEAKNGLILSLSASDWVECKRHNGRSAAMDRLNRIRDLFFADEFSFGASKIPIARQSATRKFRNNGENARWEIGNVLFATINLPAGNNHYLPDAGRNSEFEDRAIANRDWLTRLFKIAARKKLKGLVLFCDGDPLLAPSAQTLANLNGQRDGFLEVRKQIQTLSAKYTGRVLVVHGQSGTKPAAARIAWQKNLGNLEVGAGWTKLTADPSSASLFSVKADPEVARNQH